MNFYELIININRYHTLIILSMSKSKETENNKFIYESTIMNDHIDIFAEPDVRIKKLQSRNDNELRLEIEGKSIDYSIVNAIRRTILTSIPVYAFHRSNIFIDVEKSRNMYNNDLLYNQIETLPIFDIPNYFDLENPEIFLPNEVMKKLFSNFVPESYLDEMDQEKQPELNKKFFKIEFSINLKNNTGNDKFVTTHDAILKIDGKTSNSYQIRKPICIMVLKPTEEISLRAEANLGISKMYGCYEATTLAFHEEITPMKYNLWYETLEQLDKHIIFTKACIILTKKLENLREFIKKKFADHNEPSNDETVEIQLYGEDHTLGNLLATVLQKCDYVQKAAYTMPHAFIDQIIIVYKLVPKSKLGTIKVFINCVEYLIRLFQMIGHIAFKNVATK